MHNSFNWKITFLMARKLCIHPQKLENKEGQEIPIKYRLRFVQSLLLESLNRSIMMSL